MTPTNGTDGGEKEEAPPARTASRRNARIRLPQMEGRRTLPQDRHDGSDPEAFDRVSASGGRFHD